MTRLAASLSLQPVVIEVASLGAGSLGGPPVLACAQKG